MNTSFSPLSKKKKEILKKRMQIQKSIRCFFDQKGFMEVETPKLVSLPGMEPNLTPFRTSLLRNKKNHDAYLITSPEYHMKKILCSGMKKIWQMCPVFRNAEEKSPYHNPEFTMIEWYITGGNYKSMADFTEELVLYISQGFAKLQKPFEHITCREAFLAYTGLHLEELYQDKDTFIKKAQGIGYAVTVRDETADIFYKIFLKDIEPHLGKKKPTFLFDYPAEFAALSKIKKDNPLFCERFELYIDGIEIANAFSELTYPKEQKERLQKERQERKELGKEVYDVDTGFIDALEYGMPKSSGIALGFDRLVMVLTGTKSISEVMWFSGEEVFE
ncbi:EF-P lysine aminoacylase GenX [Patescibacteria group bacterium]|nr:EF-P lysine aminoacylase GenX [Patescibacteria group bacterium]